MDIPYTTLPPKQIFTSLGNPIVKDTNHIILTVLEWKDKDAYGDHYHPAVKELKESYKKTGEYKHIGSYGYRNYVILVGHNDTENNAG